MLVILNRVRQLAGSRAFAITGDVAWPAPEEEVTATMGARLERLERELQREREERRQERDHWLMVWQVLILTW